MRGFKEHNAAERFCRTYDELAISPAADPATINTFQQPAVTVAFSVTLAS